MEGCISLKEVQKKTPMFLWLVLSVKGLKSVEASWVLRLQSLGVAADVSVFEQNGKYWHLLLTEVMKWGILFQVDQPAFFKSFKISSAPQPPLKEMDLHVWHDWTDTLKLANSILLLGIITHFFLLFWPILLNPGEITWPEWSSQPVQELWSC